MLVDSRQLNYSVSVYLYMFSTVQLKPSIPTLPIQSDMIPLIENNSFFWSYNSNTWSAIETEIKKNYKDSKITTLSIPSKFEMFHLISINNLMRFSKIKKYSDHIHYISLYFNSENLNECYFVFFQIDISWNRFPWTHIDYMRILQ